ncbi:PAS domain S-box protein [Couchioplanes caeruleus]|uniref:Diguanylate cyclase n=2 Tax=Couchioplanes caeruleus TaxID=56438 RepID=A0A1K0F9L7_9ACTN|nr:PAS domain S-box protein [Couchioplanes caeruleus]OJF09543.1 diguanylate cyclase [Couchioplanes caeruleus subsp. caeruleus]ROP29609.1 PAS domain S-box-containing protein [Couchioplanes caeruleus]
MLQALEWILFGAASVGAFAVGLSRHRPARLAPWLLLAASIVCLTVGDVCYALAARDAASIFYLTMFVFVALALLQFTRRGALLMSRARLIDLLAAACAALLVGWVFLIGDSGRIGAISATDVIGALLLIGVTVRLAAAAWFNWSALLLCTGAIGMLASDVAYGLDPRWPSEIGYMVLYVAWGAAALHPSMVRLTSPIPTHPPPWQGRWAALLGLSVATPPLVLLVEAVSGTVTDGVVIAVASTLTLVLTITRLADSVTLNSQALVRERALREASAALVAAADEAAVDRAVHGAVAQLLPPNDLTRVVFATDDRQLALEALPPAASGPRPRSWWLDPSHSPDSREAGDVTLVCPLWLEPLAVARPSGGALVLEGRRDILAASRDALEVLAGQAALALDRISLVDAVGRRDSDLYLRAVIRNTADIMLVVDDDQVIRYASPALHDLMGTDELPPFATLLDLVHPDDTSHVRRALREDGDGVLYCALRRPDDTQILVEATYRDLRGDRLVQGFVVTIRDVTRAHDPVERIPHVEHVDALPAWVNRRSAQHKFRY